MTRPETFTRACWKLVTQRLLQRGWHPTENGASTEMAADQSPLISTLLESQDLLWFWPATEVFHFRLLSFLSLTSATESLGFPVLNQEVFLCRGHWWETAIETATTWWLVVVWLGKVQWFDPKDGARALPALWPMRHSSSLKTEYKADRKRSCPLESKATLFIRCFKSLLFCTTLTVSYTANFMLKRLLAPRERKLKISSNGLRNSCDRCWGGVLKHAFQPDVLRLQCLVLMEAWHHDGHNPNAFRICSASQFPPLLLQGLELFPASVADSSAWLCSCGSQSVSGQMCLWWLWCTQCTVSSLHKF